MNHEHPADLSPDYDFSELIETIDGLVKDLKKLDAQKNPSDSEEHKHNIFYAQRALENAKDNFIGEVIDSDLPFDDKLALLEQVDVKLVIDDDISVYQQALEPFQPGTPVIYGTYLGKNLFTRGVIEHSPTLVLHPGYKPGTVRLRASIAIKSEGVTEDERFNLVKREAGHIKLVGIEPDTDSHESDQL